MVVFPLKWLPFILIIGGIGIAIEGEPAALILSVIGGVWLYLKYADNNTRKKLRSGITNTINKASGATQKAINVVNDSVSSRVKTVKASADAHKKTTVDENPPAKNYCSHCGAKVVENDLYCSECGHRL